jgi:hypothetical protein
MNKIPCELLKCDDYDKINRVCTCNKQYIDKDSKETKFICKCDSRAILMEEK